MQVGIIPTDTLPAIVADLENREAVLKLYAAKEMSIKKPLSILCRNFQDISHYTGGFPVSNEAGARNWFNILKRLLPGPVSLSSWSTERRLWLGCTESSRAQYLPRPSPPPHSPFPSLPLQYTLILPASKNLPTQMVDFMKVGASQRFHVSSHAGEGLRGSSHSQSSPHWCGMLLSSHPTLPTPFC